MACRGIFYAVTREEARRLISAAEAGDDALMEVVHSLWAEERIAEGFQAGCDKAWDAMHRCLTDGTLRVGDVSEPIDRFVLGGRSLHRGDDNIVCLVSAAQVIDVAAAASEMTETEFAERYWKLDPNQYDGPMNRLDLEYTWEYFKSARELYVKAADDVRAVLFYADQ